MKTKSFCNDLDYSTKDVAKFDNAAQNKDKDLPSATSSSIAPFTCEKHHWILPSPSPSPTRAHTKLSKYNFTRVNPQLTWLKRVTSPYSQNNCVIY